MSEINTDPHGDPIEQELFASLERLQHSPGDPNINREVGDLLCALHRYGEAIIYYRNALAAEPQNPDAWYALGIAASCADALDTAQQALEKTIELGRDDSNVRAELASVLGRLGKPAAAIEQATPALQLARHPVQRGRLHALIGYCYAEIGDLEGALIHFQDAVRENPEDATAQHSLGAIYARRNQFAAAISHLENAAALAPNSPDVWYALGRAANEAGVFDKASQALQKTIALGRVDANVLAELASVLRLLQQPEVAVEKAKQALSHAQDLCTRSWIESILAACYTDLEDSESALMHLKEAVKLDPEYAVAQYNLGLAYGQRGHFDIAVVHLKKAADLAPENAEAWYSLGFAASRANDLLLARQAFQKALSLGHDEVSTRKELAWVHQSLNEWDSAIDQANQALQSIVEPKARAWLHGILAYCYRQRGKMDEALAHFEAAVEADPEDAEAHYSLGLEHENREEFDAAIPHLEKAVALAPEDSRYRLSLAQVYAEVRNSDQAERILRELLSSDQHESAHILLVKCALNEDRIAEALRIAKTEAEARPDSPVAWAALSMVLDKIGDKSGALNVLEKAQELGPQEPWVEWARSECESTDFKNAPELPKSNSHPQDRGPGEAG